MTFDDGPGVSRNLNLPGPKTLQLAKYLSDENIVATFFMVGRAMIRNMKVVAAISEMNHIIGNHTFNHLNLTNELHSKNLTWELDAVSEILYSYTKTDKIYFRAPWGLWTKSLSSYFNENCSRDFEYAGPYLWDLNCNDWHFWLNKKKAEECALAYTESILQAERGIILMHDSSADLPVSKKNNLTFESIKIMVPILKAKGFKFISISDVGANLETGIIKI